MGRFRYVLWAGLVIVLVAGLLFGLVALRRIGHGETLTALIKRHEAEGRGTKLEDVLDREPDLDAKLQEQAAAWMAQRSRSGPDFSPDEPSAWFLDGAAEPPEKTRAAHDSLRPAMEELAKLLREPRLCLSNLGWLREHLTRREPGTSDFRLTFNMKLPSSWHLLGAASWFQVQALRGETDAALTSLDRLADAMRPVGTFMDAVFLHAVLHRRDLTHVALAMRDRLPAARRDAWLSEQPQPASSMAAAYRAERILHALPLARVVADGDLGAVRKTYFFLSDNIVERIDHEMYLRWSAAGEAAQAVDLKARIADYLRDPAAYPKLAETDAWMAGAEHLLRAELHVWRQALKGLLWHTTFHRAARLAVRALDLHRRGLLPADEAALREALGSNAVLLDAGPWSLALRYEPPSGGRLRFSIAAEGALPAFVRPEDESSYRGVEGFDRVPAGVNLRLDDKGVLLRLP